MLLSIGWAAKAIEVVKTFSPLLIGEDAAVETKMHNMQDRLELSVPSSSGKMLL